MRAHARWPSAELGEPGDDAADRCPGNTAKGLPGLHSSYLLHDAAERTVFEAVGTGLEDLAAAMLAFQGAGEPPAGGFVVKGTASMAIRARLSESSIRGASAARREGAVFLPALLGIGLPASSNELPAIASTESSAPSAAAMLQGQPLIAALRRGGHVVYFRHTATDFSRNDAGMRSYDDCANQRPLSDQGRRDAAEIGQRIRALGLPVGEALASPFCRTMEHARLMLSDVTPRFEIREAEGGDYAGLKRLLATPVPAGGNRWIVGHGIPFRAVAGPPHLAEGEAVVIRPDGTGWTVVARLGVADWQALPPGP